MHKRVNSMSAESLPLWFDLPAIEKALSRQKAPDAIELRDILDKSMRMEALNQDEIVALMRVDDPVGHERILAVADEVKQRVYGDRMVLSAPLHLSNHCGSECLYC